MTITIETLVTRPRNTDTGVRDGVDYDAEVRITDADGAVRQLTGELTYAPDAYSGELRPYGPAVDYWMTGRLMADVASLGGEIARTIIASLAGGKGRETIEVTL
jgi:hypothetical protein